MVDCRSIKYNCISYLSQPTKDIFNPPGSGTPREVKSHPKSRAVSLILRLPRATRCTALTAPRSRQRASVEETSELFHISRAPFQPICCRWSPTRRAAAGALQKCSPVPGVKGYGDDFAIFLEISPYTGWVINNGTQIKDVHTLSGCCLRFFVIQGVKVEKIFPTEYFWTD